ncbi:substrate-binding domain-containing protein [Actinomadura sp. NAK00032]|uniref:substrate-binding domain-containing protein n=1 Tax=Actinomadura sp. NAK00032 TaxID=2742128 RepID=UPI001592319F|nr:substrate-binding domain-containing protein [Actinomadura sp. NAK00032]QKW34174.1 substrate-binding domain-containing protein [Actinomadura sp. NAK00032]
MVLIAGVAALLVVGALLGVRQAAGGGCDGRVTVSLAADPAVAPALTALAGRFNGAEHEVGGRCAEVTVNTLPSAAMALALGGDRSAAQARADAYVLDSSLWLEIAGRTAERTGTAPPKPIGSVASSPVVLARAKGAEPLSWRSMTPDGAVSLRLPAPEQNAAGMVALLMAKRAAGTGDQAIAGFTGILASAQSVEGSARGEAAAFDGLVRFGGGKTPVLAVPEQSVWRRATAGGAPVQAVLPADGTMALDFPLVVAAGAKAAAARRFLAEVGTREGADALAKAGLRPAGGGPAPAVSAVTGVGAVPATSPPAPGAVSEALEMWRRMHLGTRMLTVIDVSGSMLEQVPGTGRSRMAVTAGEVEKGISLMPDSAEMGLWAFSTGMDGPRPYKELAPVGRLGATDGGLPHRAAMQQALARMRAKPDGDTGLYDSVLAAYRTVKAGYRDDMINIVLVLTDGRNDFAGGLSERTLLAQLKAEYDASRPVQVVGLGFGPGVDLGALQRIARATGGAAYQIRDPRQIHALFQQSAALKICDDPRQCPTG